MHHLRDEGWCGVWVNVFADELWSELIPAPGLKTITQTGAPMWAVEVSDCLRAANGGKLGVSASSSSWR